METEIAYTKIDNAINELNIIKTNCELCKLKKKYKFKKLINDNFFDYQIKIKYKIGIPTNLYWFSTPPFLKLQDTALANEKKSTMYEVTGTPYTVSHDFAMPDKGALEPGDRKTEVLNLNVIIPQVQEARELVTDSKYKVSVAKLKARIDDYANFANKKNEERKKYNQSIDNLIEAIDSEIKRLETIKTKYQEIDKETPDGDSPLTPAQLVNKIRKNLKNGKIKKANKWYQKLKELKGNKWAKQRINKMIKKMGFNVKISNGKIVSIIKTKLIPVPPSDTGANVINPQNVVSVAAVATPFLVMEKESFLIDEDAWGNSNKALIYEEYAEKISKIDPNDPSAKKQIENLKKEMEEKLDEIDNQVLKNKEKIESEYNNGIRTQQADDESVSIGYKNSLSGQQYSEEQLNEASNSYDVIIEKKLKEIHNSSSTSTNTTPVTPNQSNDSVATQEPTPQPSQPQNQTPSPAPQPQQNTPSQQPNSNTSYVNRGSNSVNTVPTQTETTSESNATPEVPSDTETLVDTEESNIDSILESEDTISDNNVVIDDVPTPTKKKSSGMSGVVPAVLGVGAVGAAAVAGVRYVKNRKQTEDIDDSYDDENNNTDSYSSNSEYMKDDYLGPAGSEYTDTSSYESVPNDIVPNNSKYTSTESLEDDSDDDFSNDIAYNSIV